MYASSIMRSFKRQSSGDDWNTHTVIQNNKNANGIKAL